MIWLRWKIGGTTQSLRINETHLEVRHETDRMNERTLRGSDVDHLLSYRRAYDLEIGADELAVIATRSFMESFWISHRRWIAFSASETEPDDEDFIELTLPGGRDPVEFLEEELGLPFITYAITEKHKRT